MEILDTDSHEIRLAKTYTSHELSTIPMMHEYNGHSYYGTTRRPQWWSERCRKQSKIDGGYCNLEGETIFEAYRETGETQAETKRHKMILTNGNNIDIISYTFFNYDDWDKTEVQIYCTCDKKPTAKQIEKIKALAAKISYNGKPQIKIEVKGD